MSQAVIRTYQENDAPSVGRLIADTFGGINLSYASPEERDALLGPFRHANSAEPVHQEAIAEVIRSDVVLVAEDRGEIVGVLRGYPGPAEMDAPPPHDAKLQSLFVREDRHRQGIGGRLVARFENECRSRGASVIRLQATLFAVPFYQAVGYKRSTGVRSCKIFDGARFPYQPMKKMLQP